MKKHFLVFVLLAVCILSAVFVVQAEAPEGNGIYAEAVQMTVDGILSGGSITAQCPRCGESAAWTPLTSISNVQHIRDGGHYYLTQDLSNKTYYHFYGNACLHLNGHSITSAGRAIYVETNAKLNIMGDGTVSGKGFESSICDRGGALDIAGVVNLYGGTYMHNGDYPVITSRGSSGGINIYDGTRVTGTSGYNGSNIRVYVSYLNVYGGTIEKGIGTQGGNIYGGKNAKITIAGGTITGSTVYMAENSTSLTLKGAPKVDVINNFDGPAAGISGLTEGADIQIVGQGTITESLNNISDYAKYLRSPNELVKLSVKDNAVFATVDTTADSTAPLSDGKSLKILCLTSSFGLNTTELLYDIAVAEGFEDVIVARLYASGCTLQKHVNSYNSDTGIYWYTKFTSEGKESVYDAKLLDGLLDEDWDIIYIQQGAEQTPQLHTYEDYLDQFMEIIHANKTNPDAKFIWNMTWAFQGDNPRKIFTDTFQGDQMLMHEAIIDAMQEKILTRSDFCAMIPTGAAVQSARTSYFGDHLTKDTLHLNNLGRVIAGYTVLATVLDKDITEVNVGAVKSYDLTTPIRLSEIDREIVMEVVKAAREDPFAVIQSKYTPEFLNGIGAKAENLSFTTGEATTAVCPLCEKSVTWYPLTNSSENLLTTTEGKQGHYYLAEDLTVSDKYFYMTTAEDHAGYCLHLNGHNIENTGKRALWVGAGNTLNIMGSGTVSGVGEGSSDSDYRGAALDLNGIVNLFGGTYTPLAARPSILMRTSATRLYIFDGATVQGNESYSAPLIQPNIGGAEVNMFGGTVTGGKAVNGGNIYMPKKSVFNMFGGTVEGGQSTKIGGNIYAANGTINLYGGSIYGGYVTNSSSSYGRGGNVALNGSKDVTPVLNMYGGTIGCETVTGEAAGYASTGGANLYVAYGNVNIMGENALISGGYGKSYGGNIMIGTEGYVTLTAGTIQNGNAPKGGNVYLAGTSSHYIQNGGTVKDGTSKTSGGNIIVNNGEFIFAGGTVAGGTAPIGSNLHLKTGKADTANFALIHHDASVSATAPVISGGEVYCEYNVTLGTFTSTADFNFASSAVLTAQDGLVLENAAFTDQVIDLTGKAVTLSGSGSITCYDSANEDFKTYGTLALSGVTLSNTGYNEVNGKNYFTLEENGTYSFHRLDMALTGVALRPSAAGMYFNAVWNCDAKMAEAIDTHGVVVSLHNMPGSDFMRDPEEDNLWTVFEALTPGEEKTGVLITGILKEDRAPQLNQAYNQMPVSAAAYFTVGDTTYTTGSVQLSLYELLTLVLEGGHDLTDFLAYWSNYGFEIRKEDAL